MELEKFKNVLNIIRDFDKTISVIEGLKINMIDSQICTDFWSLQEVLLSEVYTKEGYEWISYYLYEIPYMLEKDKKNGNVRDDVFAKDVDGNPIDLSSDEALWEFLEKNYLK